MVSHSEIERSDEYIPVSGLCQQKLIAVMIVFVFLIFTWPGFLSLLILPKYIHIIIGRVLLDTLGNFYS